MFSKLVQNYLQILLISIFLILMLCFIFVDTNLKKIPKTTSSKSYEKVILEESEKISNETKTVLYWDDFFGKKDFGFGIGSEPFKNCEIQACYATYYNQSNIPVEKFDAVLFHGARFSVKEHGLPRKRSPHQKYIFYALESYFNTNFEVKTNKNFYNWTMSYKRDSDIFHPYGKLIEKSTNYTLPSIEELKTRKKQIAWFVSNCNAKRRKRYVKELQKYIPVDIYGACGPFKCPRSEKCFKLIEKNYKFYISFENTFCEDYVTEKVYNILSYNVIPIVFSFVDYNALFPDNSLINANDFINPKHLAEYLWSLDGNATEYLKFFEWKKKFVVKNELYNLCELCKKLHEPLVYSNYKDVKDWYFGYSCVA